MKWGGGFDDFAKFVIDGSRPEEIERAIRFGWYLIRVEGCQEFSATEISELFRRAHVSRPNVTRLSERLSNTRRTFRGSVPGTFRLTAATLSELDEEFVVEDEHAEANVFTSDLEDKLDSLPSQHVKSFVAEAIGCLRGGHLRAAVVLTWIGAIALLHEYVANHRLADINADARSNGLLKRDAKGASDFQRIKDADFLDAIERIGLVSGAIKKELKICLDRRNNCGHPNDFIPTEKMVAAHIEALLMYVFRRF